MAKPGHGTLLKMGDGGEPEVFQTVAEVLDIRDAGGYTVATEDSTSHDSPDAWGEKIATIITAKDVTFDIQYDPTDPTHDESTGIWAQGASRTLRNWQVVPPVAGAKKIQFAAYVTDVGPAFPVAGKITCSITLTPTGKIEWVA